jgi:bacterioferritin-associated ferredoxin
MYVCICNAVTDSQIIEAAQDGNSLKQITRKLGVGTCCGQCIPTAREVLSELEQVKKYIPAVQFNDNSKSV